MFLHCVDPNNDGADGGAPQKGKMEYAEWRILIVVYYFWGSDRSVLINWYIYMIILDYHNYKFVIIKRLMDAKEWWLI